MTTIFGDKHDIAIEAGIEPDKHTQSTVWGRMCLWCNGHSIGDLEERYCCIGIAHDLLLRTNSILDSLWHNEMIGQDNQSIYNLLDGIIYGYREGVELIDDESWERYRSKINFWMNFDFLNNWGEQFDGYKSFICSPPGNQTLILTQRKNEVKCQGFLVSRNTFSEAVKQFSLWFEAESKRLGVPCLQTFRSQMP